MTRHRRAMAGFGESVFSLGRMLGQEVISQLVQSEFVEGKALLQQRNNEFFESIVEDQDYEKLSERYNKESKKWQEETLSRYKTPGARNALKNMITADAPRYESDLNEIIEGKAQEDALRKLSSSIEGFIPSVGTIPEELELGIINATAAAQGAVGTGLISKDEAEEWVIQALMEDWPKAAIEKIEASKLNPLRKRQLQSQARAVIRNNEIEQRRIQQEVWDKTEGEAFNLLFDNKLTPEWIREQFNSGNLSASDRDAYLSTLLRPKEVALNWEVYDRISEMVEDYDKGKVTKDEVRLAITKALGKDISTTVAVKLRDKLNTIDEPDNPMNRSDVKRGLGFLKDLESYEIEVIKEAKKGKEKDKAIKESRLKWLKKKDELERWIKGQEKLTDTEIQNKIDQMTKISAEEVSKDLLDRLWNLWVQSPFGVGYRKIAGIEKEGKKEESPYPEYPDAFLEDGVWKVIKDGKKYRIE